MTMIGSKPWESVTVLRFIYMQLRMNSMIPPYCADVEQKGQFCSNPYGSSPTRDHSQPLSIIGKYETAPYSPYLVIDAALSIAIRSSASACVRLISATRTPHPFGDPIFFCAG